jgi:uncharacterized coiled-coil protein SlyX
MILGGAFADGAVQVSITVIAALLIAGSVATVRFMLRVRDSLHGQDKQLEDIGKAVNHVPPGEPRLYDLVVEVVEKQAETAHESQKMALAMRDMRNQVDRHLRDDEERFAKQDIVLDEVRGVVLDLRDKVEVNTEALESINDKVIDLSVTVDALTAD